MRNLTDLQMDILVILFDDKGHALWELSKLLHRAKSNLTITLANLEMEIDGISMIYKGEARSTTNPESTHPHQTEFPYYIKRDIKVYQLINDYYSNKIKYFSDKVWHSSKYADKLDEDSMNKYFINSQLKANFEQSLYIKNMESSLGCDKALFDIFKG